MDIIQNIELKKAKIIEFEKIVREIDMPHLRSVGRCYEDSEEGFILIDIDYLYSRYYNPNLYIFDNGSRIQILELHRECCTIASNYYISPDTLKKHYGIDAIQ